jgi:hypothetical protein
VYLYIKNIAKAIAKYPPWVYNIDVPRRYRKAGRTWRK